MTGSKQTASFMHSHKRRRVKVGDRGKVPTQHPSTSDDAHTTPYSLLGRMTAPHGTHCTAAGADVTYCATFLTAGWRRWRGHKCLDGCVCVEGGGYWCVCVNTMTISERLLGSVKWVRDKSSQCFTVTRDLENEGQEQPCLPSQFTPEHEVQWRV